MTINLADIMADAQYAALPEIQRDRVRRIANCLYAAGAHPRITGNGGLLEQLADILGCTVANAQRIYYRYRKSGHWQDLADARCNPPQDLPDAGACSPRFQAWVQRVAESNQRTTAQALQYIRECLIAGNKTITVPGFENWPGGSVPAGCSDTSLRNRIKRARLANKRLGLKTNAAHRLPLLTTRKDTEPGQVYEFDDVWHDNLVLWPGQAEPVRVLEFGALDMASACRISWGSIPRFDKNDGKRQGLTQRMFTLFLADLLYRIGYHRDGCTLIMEHGTATLPEHIATLLTESNLGITIRQGGISGHQQAKLGGYTGQIGGNPRAKAQIESSHNGLHNFLAYLPGQVGKDRQHYAEETYGMLKAQQLVEMWRAKLRENGRDDLAAALCNHFISYHEFMEILALKVTQWNARTNHNLEGWEKHTTPEYQLIPGQWTPAALLTNNGTQPLPAIIAAAAQANPAMVRMRKLSPQEVWAAGNATLRRIPFATYVDMLRGADMFGKRLRVYGGLLTVQDKVIGKDKLHYIAEVYAHGRKYFLEENETVSAVLNPYNINNLIILDDAGRIMGEAPLYTRTNLGNTEALHEQMGRVAAYNARRNAMQQALYEEDTARVNLLHQYNKTIAAQGGALQQPTRSKPAAHVRKSPMTLAPEPEAPAISYKPTTPRRLPDAPGSQTYL